jgi:hypothetical protein
MLASPLLLWPYTYPYTYPTSARLLVAFTDLGRQQYQSSLGSIGDIICACLVGISVVLDWSCPAGGRLPGLLEVASTGESGDRQLAADSCGSPVLPALVHVPAASVPLRCVYPLTAMPVQVVLAGAVFTGWLC